MRSRDTRFLGVAVAALVLSLVAGCAANPFASTSADAAAKQFRGDAESGVVYVYRDERFGGSKPMPVFLNGRYMGQTAGRTYFRWELEPGSHSLATRRNADDPITLELRPGEILFVWQELSVGRYGELRAQLHRVEAERGRAAVRQCELLADSR